MSLSRLNLIPFLAILTVASPVWAEAQQANAKSPQPRPLNLSLPRDVLLTPDRDPADETVLRNLRAPVPNQKRGQTPGQLRYGAGYEHRHQEMHGTALDGAGAGGGAGASPAAGSGRRGR